MSEMADFDAIAAVERGQMLAQPWYELLERAKVMGGRLLTNKDLLEYSPEKHEGPVFASQGEFVNVVTEDGVTKASALRAYRGLLRIYQDQNSEFYLSDLPDLEFKPEPPSHDLPGQVLRDAASYHINVDSLAYFMEEIDAILELRKSGSAKKRVYDLDLPRQVGAGMLGMYRYFVATKLDKTEE